MMKILIDEKMEQKDNRGIIRLTEKGTERAGEIYDRVSLFTSIPT